MKVLCLVTYLTMFGNEDLFSPYKHAKKFGILVGSLRPCTPMMVVRVGFLNFLKMIKGGSHPYLTRVFFYTLSKDVIHISPPIAW
jgi:hypothetical protein